MAKNGFLFGQPFPSADWLKHEHEIIWYMFVEHNMQYCPQQSQHAKLEWLSTFSVAVLEQTVNDSSGVVILIAFLNVKDTMQFYEFMFINNAKKHCHSIYAAKLFYIYPGNRFENKTKLNEQNKTRSCSYLREVLGMNVRNRRSPNRG